MEMSKAMQDVSRVVGRPISLLSQFLSWLDSRLRGQDQKLNYTYGSPLNLLLKAPGHYFGISFVLLFLSVYIVLGPNLDVSSREAVIAELICVLLVVLIPLKIASAASLFFWQLLFVLLSTAAIWFGLAIEQGQAQGEIYRHIFIPALWIVSFGLLLARAFADGLMAECRGQFADALQRFELFRSENEESVSATLQEFLRSLLTVPFYQLHKWLFFPAIIVLVVADRDLMKVLAYVMLGMSAIYLAAAGVHRRLAYMRELLNGMFFKGAHLVISLLLIGLALGRWFEQSHITTLIETSPGEVNLTILRFFIAAYVLFWFFEYWANRFLIDHFLALFKQQVDAQTPGRIEFESHVGGGDVDPKGRVVQAHAGSRLILLGRDSQGRPRWNLFSRGDFLNAVTNKLDREDEDDYQLVVKADVIRQRMRLYFLLLNAYLVASFFILYYWSSHQPQLAELQARAEVTQDEVNRLFDLNGAIFGTRRLGADEPRLFVAASGGGTRAALYGESVLRGLRELDVLNNVLLTSSVSGGSAAMAYFSVYRDQLLAGDPQQHDAPVDDEQQRQNAWQVFSATMAAPYILDVLQGIVDWRLTGGIEQHNPDAGSADAASFNAVMRMGDLLAESMQRRFQLHEHDDRDQLGEQHQFGMIFNTTLVARFPRWSCNDVKNNQAWSACVCVDEQGNLATLAQRESRCADLKTSLGQGGRLVMTNLRDLSGFPSSGEPVNKTDFLSYVALQDPDVGLHRAAALSANFPPVFPNAAVDVDNAQRYWVTDGGASDNRGLLSLLYTIRQAIVDEMAKRCVDRECRQENLPPLHVVIADASATNLSFSGNTGIPAALGAPTRFASQLIVDLAADIKRMYRVLGGSAHFHYLPMPLVLRSDGLGTHWMMPSEVNFKQPKDVARLDQTMDKQKATLSAIDTRQLIDDLHSTKHALQPSEDSERVWQWICREQFGAHQQRWVKLVKLLKPDAQVADICRSAEAGAQ